MKKNILVVGPLDSNGRYEGGINKILNYLEKYSDIFLQNGYKLMFQNSCLKKRNNKSIGKLSLKNILNAISLKKEIKKKLKEYSCNIIYWHSSNRFALLKDLIIIKQLNAPNVVLHIHYSEIKKILFNKKILDKFLCRLINKNVSSIVTMSKSTCQDFINFGIQAEKVTYIHNFYCLESNKVTHTYHTNFANFIFIGSLDKRKGILDILEALYEINNDNYSLSICGLFINDQIKDLFYKKIKEYQLEDKVKYLGYLDDGKKQQVYSESDCLILPSYEEGLPLVILESLAMGLDIICSPVGSIPDIIMNEKNSLFCSPGDIESIRTALEKVIIDRNSSICRGKRNYLLSKDFSIDNFLKQLINLFDNIGK